MLHPDTEADQLLTAASHALRSYQYHNASPELAEGIANDIDAYLARSDDHPGVSQTLLEAAITQPRPVFSCFVNLLQSEEARKQIILVIDGPAA